MMNAECPGAFRQSRHLLDIHSLRLQKHTKIDRTQTVLRQLSRASHTYSHRCPFLPSSRPCHLSQAISDRDNSSLKAFWTYTWRMAGKEALRRMSIDGNC